MMGNEYLEIAEIGQSTAQTEVQIAQRVHDGGQQSVVGPRWARHLSITNRVDFSYTVNGENASEGFTLWTWSSSSQRMVHLRGAVG